MAQNVHLGPTLQTAARLKERTKSFALRVIRVVRALPREEAARVIGRQMLRSGTSVAANYRAATRARSGREFISKLGVVIEEADETALWLELLVEINVIAPVKLSPLIKEAYELVAIFGASQSTARRNLQATPRKSH
jgi:four helix bundle protein